MPELPKFDDEDLKSYGDEEEELALCVIFPHIFIRLFSVFLRSFTGAEICSRVFVCQEMLKGNNDMAMTIESQILKIFSIIC